MLNVAYLPRLYDGVEPTKESNTIHGYFLKHADVFESYGVRLTLNGKAEDNDLAWIGNGVWDSKMPEYSGLPLIQELVLDSSWLDLRGRKCLQNERVIGMTRGCVLRDLEEYNRTFFQASYHSKLIYEADEEKFEDKPKRANLILTTEELKKMIVSPSFAHLLRHNAIYSWAENNVDIATGAGERTTSCHFVGAVEFIRSAITHHRKLAADIVNSVPGSLSVGNESRQSDNRMNRAEYFDTLRRSRVCVSPWGYGERCHRDYEAILCGCVLVKPDTSHLAMFPDMFDPMVGCYIPCRTDFSDLKDIIEDVNLNWSSYQDMRVKALQYLLESYKPTNAIKGIAQDILDRYQIYSDNTAVKVAATG